MVIQALGLLGKQNVGLMLDAKEAFHSRAALLVIICCHNPKTIENPWTAGSASSGHILVCVCVCVCVYVYQFVSVFALSDN